MTDKRVGYFHELASQFPNPENIRSITTDINGNVINVEYWRSDTIVTADEILSGLADPEDPGKPTTVA